LKLLDADTQLVRDLDISLRTAAAAGADTEEIQRITSARAKAQEMLKHDTLEAHGVGEFVIKADSGWQDTLEVHHGDQVIIQASGRWTANAKNARQTCGPDGIAGAPSPTGVLIGIIAGQPDNAAILIGSSKQFTAPTDGVLQLGMRNHAPVGSGLNDGAIEVLIKVVPASH
jgi:hypothetical protein